MSKLDLSQIDRFLNQLSVRLGHVSQTDLLMMILAILVPPLAVFIKVGASTHFWINLILTLLGYVPGILHGLWVVLFL